MCNLVLHDAAIDDTGPQCNVPVYLIRILKYYTDMAGFVYLKITI